QVNAPSSFISMNSTDTELTSLRILQLNIRKSPAAHLDLANCSLASDWDVILVQEPNIIFTNDICTPNNFRPVIPSNHHNLEHPVQSVIWVNKSISTNQWSIIDIPDTNDISTIQIRNSQHTINIFNIYNDCSHSNSL
ncbi:hypothetical protein BDQ17DRAFT_1169128, partial [Cyathus striatus]